MMGYLETYLYSDERFECLGDFFFFFLFGTVYLRDKGLNS